MNPLLAGMGINAATSIFSGLLGADASEDASQAQLAAINQAQGQLNQYLQQGLGYQQPIYQSGMQNLSQVNQNMASGSYNVQPYSYQAQPFNFQADPGYNFAKQQGIGAINANAAANGMQLSSGTQKNLAKFTTGLADQTYNNAYNRYMTGQQFNAGNAMNSYQTRNQQAQQRYDMGLNLANMGIGAANNMSNLTMSAGNNIAELTGQAGTVRASGIMGQAQQYGGMLNNLGSMGMLYGLIKDPTTKK